MRQAASECVSHASHAALQLVALFKGRRLQRQGAMHDLAFACSMPACSIVRVSHLQAYVLHGKPPQPRQWWFFNDSHVERKPKSFCPSQFIETRRNACLLIYQAATRQDPPAQAPAPVRATRSVAGCPTASQTLNRVLTSTVHAMLGGAPSPVPCLL